MTGRQEPQLWNNLGLTFTRRLFASVLCRSSFAPGRNATSSLALRRAVAGPGLTSKWRYSQESTPPRVADEDLEEDTSKATCRLRSTTRSHLEPYRPVPESRNLAHGIDRQDPQSACAACGLPVSTRLPAASAAAPTRLLTPRKRKNGPSSSTAPSVACQLYRVSKVDVPPCHGYSATPTRILCVIIAVAPATLR